MGSCGSIRGVKTEVLLQDAGEYLEVKTLACTQILGAAIPNPHKPTGFGVSLLPFRGRSAGHCNYSHSHSFFFFSPSASRKAVTYLLF